ncbi:unnamed protein product [Zymoseptoria tritici ST99CH_1A5]|uniref:Uncharacterized protein n=2 Tax=Zymoseptoria tritici TaxID=1047171 RepID=A0A2H1GAX4_ZYMTR|nr:unnamed protein product [Zymoseptoria tritici ST99CH_1E4]SMY23415.1 unnamed protein product [Zymoseptoria tritici ST99CH_1A5]
MLQFIQDYFGLQQEPYDETLPDVPPRILLTVITSSDIMSKSDTAPFSITFQAVVDGDRSVTVDVFHTILWRSFPTKHYEGFTFTDSRTQMKAPLPVRDIQYHVPGYLEASDECVAEIPTKVSGDLPYEVSFTTGNNDAMQTGHEYEIGLGPKDEISWWKMGSKAQVFAAPNERRGRHLDEDVPKLRMVLVNKATFKVVG